MYGKGDYLGNFSMIAWSIWRGRNKFFHESRLLTSFEVLSRVIPLWSHSLACEPAVAPRISPQTESSLWLAPPSGFIKINVDVAVVQGSSRGGIGVVARDEHGLVLETQILSVEGAFSAHVELLAAREGMLIVFKHLWTHIICESDVSNVINSINLRY